MHFYCFSGRGLEGESVGREMAMAASGRRVGWKGGPIKQDRMFLSDEDDCRIEFGAATGPAMADFTRTRVAAGIRVRSSEHRGLAPAPARS